MTRWLPVAALLALAGCAAPPPPPTVVTLTLTTTPDVNPTADDVGAPIALRVYQLASAANFNVAEFFPLYNSDAAVLKTDLVRREDFLLSPGQTRSETIRPDPAVKAIAVLAAYRDIRHARWRASVDIMPNTTATLTVTAGHDGVTMR